MKTHLTFWITIALVLAVAVGGCVTPQAAPPPQQTATLPPICQSLESQNPPSDLSGKDVVNEMITRLNDGDIPGAMAYFAEDARVYISGVPPVGFEIHDGKEAICRILAGYVNDNLEWDVKINAVNTFSNITRITANSNIWLDHYRQNNVAPNEFSDLIVVRDGRITQYAQTLDNESLAKLRTNLQDDFPKTVSDKSAPGSAANISFSNLSCTYDGPTKWKTGEFEFNLEIKDQKDAQYGLVLINLDDGYDFFDLATAIDGEKPPWVRYHNLAEFTGWKSQIVQYAIEGNSKYLMCMGTEGLGYVIGLLGPFYIQP